MSNKTEFTITEDHLKLIRNFYIDYDDWCEFGAPRIDPKRPYGNSYVYGDINEILGNRYKEDEEEGYGFSDEDSAEMLRLHRETTMALQIAICVGRFESGTYQRPNSYTNDWKKIDPQ